jgi:CheY-like chemotaxis protein
VLVIEDEPSIRRSIVNYLEDAGYAVDEAQNGAEGWLRVQRSTPDVIVVDLRMPVMGGREFVGLLRGDPHVAAVPVVLLSASNDLPDAAAELQPRAALAKPVDLDVLLAIIHRVAAS